MGSGRGGVPGSYAFLRLPVGLCMCGSAGLAIPKLGVEKQEAYSLFSVAHSCATARRARAGNTIGRPNILLEVFVPFLLKSTCGDGPPTGSPIYVSMVEPTAEAYR